MDFRGFVLLVVALLASLYAATIWIDAVKNGRTWTAMAKMVVVALVLLVLLFSLD